MARRRDHRHLEGRPGGPLGRVRLALIRTEGEGEKSSWLLHRMKTDAAGHLQPDGVVVEPTRQADEPRSGRAASRSRADPAKGARLTSESDEAGPRDPDAPVGVSADGLASAPPATWPPTPADLRPMLS